MKKSTKALCCYKTNTHPSLQREHMGCGRRSAGMCLKGSIMVGRGGGVSYSITWRWAVTKCAFAEGMAAKLICGRRNSNSIWLTSNCISTQSGSSWGSCALKGVNLCSRGGGGLQFPDWTGQQVCTEPRTQLDKYSTALPEKQMEPPITHDRASDRQTQELVCTNLKPPQMIYLKNDQTFSIFLSQNTLSSNSHLLNAHSCI